MTGDSLKHLGDRGFWNPLEERSMQLTLESAVQAIAQVQAAYNCSDLEAITKMQGAAAQAGDEASLECLCLIKATLLGL